MRFPRGFTYLAVLFAVAIIGAVLAATAVIWHTQVQREKEQELLFVGHAFRQAIARYYESTPGTAKQFPKKLEDLLEDKRQTRLSRYLRKVYTDPMTASKTWGLIVGPDGSLIGVHSLSTRTPIKSAGFDEIDRDFVGAASYIDWKFIYTQPTQATPPATPPNPTGTPTNTPSQANPTPEAQ